MSLSCMPDEVLELVASQPVLNFHDLVAFTSTSRRIHDVTKFLVVQPHLIENLSGMKNPSGKTTDTGMGLICSMIVDANFTLADSHEQSEQLWQLLTRTPRLRYLALQRKPPNPLDFPRYEPSRSKTSAHPFPLRSSHFRTWSYLSNVTHLDSRGLSIHPTVLARLVRLTHLRLSFASHRDAYVASEAIDMIRALRACKQLTNLEIGLHTGTEQRERLGVVKECVATCPGLKVLNLFGTDENGRVPSLFDRWQKPEDLGLATAKLAETLKPAQSLKRLSLGLVTADPSSLATVFRTDACPELDFFRCLGPLGNGEGKRPRAEYYQVTCASWNGRQWESVPDARPERIFGMLR